MALVLGLGNPGTRYARSRHNVGWRVLEVLRERWRARPGDPAAEYRSWEAEHAGLEVTLLAPQMFMNRSGEALRAWRAGHPFDPARLLVVSDDVYLPLGRLRLRARGSSGGHLGLESIEAELASRSFARLRLGVGEAEASAGLREHVLERFDADEEAVISKTIAEAAEAVECWLTDGIKAAMNRFNRKVRKEVSEP